MTTEVAHSKQFPLDSQSLPLILISLENWGLIHLHGLDAEKYLQGQVTADVSAMTPAHNQDDWQSVTQRIHNNQIDCLLISPERLANDSFIETVLQPIADRIALMVIDETHCISDWGHDFRPDYRRIVNILRQLPANTPVLGTTATANNRVVDDIQALLGHIRIQRGSLIRESLALQTMVLPDQSSRQIGRAHV